MQTVCDIENTGTLCVHLNIEHPNRLKSKLSQEKLHFNYDV